MSACVYLIEESVVGDVVFISRMVFSVELVLFRKSSNPNTCFFCFICLFLSLSVSRTSIPLVDSCVHVHVKTIYLDVYFISMERL